MTVISVSKEELETGSVYDRMCVCGHELKHHGHVMFWFTNTMAVSQCVHPDCQIVEENPRPDRRRKQTYTRKFACEKFRPA